MTDFIATDGGGYFPNGISRSHTFHAGAGLGAMALETPDGDAMVLCLKTGFAFAVADYAEALDEAKRHAYNCPHSE